MQLISSRDALDFLSQAAPRPWVQRLLRWMAFDDELHVYSRSGKVQAHTNVAEFTLQLYETAGEWAGPKMDEAIRENYDLEFAHKLIGKDKMERVDDEAQTWGETDSPIKVDTGFFLYASDIDFEAGTLATDYIDIGGSFGDAVFPSQELFGTEFERPEYEAELRGLCFVRSQIELLLPTMQIAGTSALQPDLLDWRRSTGRPPRWDWEGALAHIVSLAQHPDGLPTGSGAQARVEEMIAEWFMEEAGDTPSESQIRQRASKVMRMIGRPKKA